MAPAEMKTRLSATQWKGLLTSGLRLPEMRALCHHLKQTDVPTQAQPFINSLKDRLQQYGP